MTDNPEPLDPVAPDDGDARAAPSMTGIQMAVEAAGSQRALAAALLSNDPGRKSVSEQAVGQWVQQGFVSPVRAHEIVKLYPHIPLRLLVDPKLVALLDPD